MRAAMTAEGREVVITEIEEPSAGDHQLLLRVDLAGICGSDLHIVNSGEPGVVLGHEFVGTVEALGAGVEDFRVGDRVCAVPALGCDRCLACLSGDPVRCANGVRIVGHGVRGGFAELVVVSALQAVRVPDGVSDELAALVEPLAVGLKVIGRARVEPGERLLVMGGGPIGLAVALWARQQGVGDIVVSEPIESRRKLALELGATAVINPASEALVEACRRVLGGPPEVVIECVGRSGLLDAAVEALAPRGRLILAGLHFEQDSFNRFSALSKELTVEFPNFTVKQGFRHTLNLLAQGRLDPLPLVTHSVPLDELPGVIRALRTPNDFGKVLVFPRAS